MHRAVPLLAELGIKYLLPGLLLVFLMYFSMFLFHYAKLDSFFNLTV